MLKLKMMTEAEHGHQPSAEQAAKSFRPPLRTNKPHHLGLGTFPHDLKKLDIPEAADSDNKPLPSNLYERGDWQNL